MAEASSIKLVRRKDEGFLFDVVDKATGRKLTEEEAAVRMGENAPPKAPELNNLAKSATITATSLRICGEGDSWINLLLPTYPKTFFNILGESFQTNNIGFPGHTFEEILAKKQYIQVLASGLYKVLIFSGGGNDFLGAGSLSELLKPKSEGGGSSNPDDYIHTTKLKSALKKLDTGYRLLAKEAKLAEPDILVLIHGYDYAVPRKNGAWLGKPLKKAGFAHDEPLALGIVAHLVNQFNGMLAKVAADIDHVRHVDVRKTVAGRWHDELHPTTKGARSVAPLFAAEINKLLTS